MTPSQILPPFLLLLLIWVPVAPVTILFWLAGLVAAAISATALVRLGFARLRRRPVDAARAIRPALALLLFVVAGVIAYHGAVADSREADAFARGVARQMQAACVRDGKCPQAPPGWPANEGGRSRMMVKSIRVDYRPREESFRISVNHPLEFMLEIEGGSKRELREANVIR